MGFVKAVIINYSDPTAAPLPVMFNPPEYQLTKSNNFAEIKTQGTSIPDCQFVSADAETLTMELLFDTSDKNFDVSLYVNKLVDLTKKFKGNSPPKLIFVWGTFIFPCFMVNISVKYEYFNTIGWPMRARANVTLKSCDLDEPSDPLESKTEVAEGYNVNQGDTLQGIAAKFLKDASKWREIAQKNSIDNPLTLASGTAIMI
ncbi:MAG: LysM peptidoglycan-binding domain-containing protein [Clostridia bacterium]|nr:LysM peptidoglycan-binding domain-containing protein [Clostridia bacterium]